MKCDEMKAWADAQRLVKEATAREAALLAEKRKAQAEAERVAREVAKVKADAERAAKEAEAEKKKKEAAKAARRAALLNAGRTPSGTLLIRTLFY